MNTRTFIWIQHNIVMTINTTIIITAMHTGITITALNTCITALNTGITEMNTNPTNLIGVDGYLRLEHKPIAVLRVLEA